jgi:hypothetical protein
VSAGAPSLSEPAEVGSLARIPGTLISPGSTFASIARRPTWLAPLLLWTAFSLIVTTVILPKIDWERATRHALERRNQTIPEDRISAIVEQQKKIGTIFSWVFGAAGPAFASLIVALVFWGAFKAFGWDTTFAQALGVTTHAFLPGILASVLLIPLLVKRETVDPQAIGDLLRSNLGFLVEKDSAKVVHSLLQSVDIFSFWSLILLVIGFSAAAKVSHKQAAGLVVTVWFLYVLGKAGLAAVF